MTTDDPNTQWIERGLAWLDELQTPIGLRASSAAGHFHALFGRDTLWTIMLVLEAARLLPGHADLTRRAAVLAASNLRALAATQGTEERPKNEEQPGKIVHEYWPKVPWHLRRYPLHAGRYYGSVDATYLYLIAAAMTWKQCKEGRDLVESLWDHVLAALHWALEAGDVDDDGLIEVQPRHPRGAGLRNQVWKDSNDSLLLEDGSWPKPPVAWVELQGYGLAAFRGMRALLQARKEDVALQGVLSERMARIEAAFTQFWLADEGCPAIALTREKQPIRLVSSNIGHALWCGALSGAYAEATANRLLRRDLLTAWGLRTLSADAYAFDPRSYHRGSIWPFDNAIAAAALWRMGRREDARLIGRRVIAAITYFTTPVELYCVLADARGVETLAPYASACAVQAWSAAGLVLFAAQLLSGENSLLHPAV